MTGSNFDRPPQILIPFDRREALSLAEAAEVAGRSSETVRRWANIEDLGRKIGGQWMLSRVALAMWLDGNRRSLRLYHSGDRTSAEVRSYFDRLGLS
jgi:hypothetical protein